MKRLLGVLLMLTTLLMAADKPVVKIGAVLPMSGDLAVYGTTYRDAIMMAKDDAGETKLAYNFIYEDSHDDASKESILAAQKLVSVDKVNALLSIWNGWFLIDPTTSPKGVIHLSQSWDYENKFRSALSFNHYPPIEAYVKTFLEEAQRRGYKRIAFAGLKGGGSILMEKATKTMAPKMGIVVSFSELVNPGDKDFRTFVAKIQETKPDLIMLVMWPPTLDIFLKQYRDYRYTTPIGGIELWFDSSMKKEFDGSWEVAADAPGPFEERFKKRWGYQPEIGTGYAYDNAIILIHAYEALYAKTGRVATGKEVADWMHENPTFVGAQGETEINKNNWIISAPAVIELRKGERIKIR